MANTLDFYLSKGFDLPTAEYYANGSRRIAGVSANRNDIYRMGVIGQFYLTFELAWKAESLFWKRRRWRCGNRFGKRYS